MKTKLLLLLLILVSTACRNSKENYDASGVFEATQILISSQGNGTLVRFDVQEGLPVEASRVLGYIDTLQLSLRKKQLYASMRAVAGRYANIDKQLAGIEQQIATLKKEQKRFENLVTAQAANQKQLDDINAQLAYLQKQSDAQKENLQNNNRSIEAEQTALRAQIAQIDDQIQKCLITSPIDGVVLAKYAEQGELAVPGRSLFLVADIDHMILRAYVTADQLTELAIGQEVRVFADYGKSDRKEYPGRISWISDQAEFTPKTIQTRDQRSNLVYAVKIATDNDGQIKRGMYGEFKIK